MILALGRLVRRCLSRGVSTTRSCTAAIRLDGQRTLFGHPWGANAACLFAAYQRQPCLVAGLSSRRRDKTPAASLSRGPRLRRLVQGHTRPSSSSCKATYLLAARDSRCRLFDAPRTCLAYPCCCHDSPHAVCRRYRWDTPLIFCGLRLQRSPHSLTVLLTVPLLSLRLPLPRLLPPFVLNPPPSSPCFSSSQHGLVPGPLLLRQVLFA